MFLEFARSPKVNDTMSEFSLKNEYSVFGPTPALAAIQVCMCVCAYACIHMYVCVCICPGHCVCVYGHCPGIHTYVRTYVCGPWPLFKYVRVSICSLPRYVIHMSVHMSSLRAGIHTGFSTKGGDRGQGGVGSNCRVET